MRCAAQFFRLRLAAWLLLYAVAIVYVSLVISPTGFTYLPRDPVAAWHIFLATPYVDNGSDQRPDWIANLIMLIPFGFLTTGVLWPRRWHWLRAPAALVALAFGILFVLAVKYAQLFFPRTVTLNYIMAQSIGVALGVVVLWLWRTTLQRVFVDQFAGGRGLVIVLIAYTAALIAYALLPFDLVLSAADLHERLAALPTLIWSLPGQGRSTGIRVIMVVMSALSTVPVGMLLALVSPKRSLVRLTLRGIGLVAVVMLAEAGMLSPTPHLLSIVLRSSGIAAGVVLLRALRAQDPVRLRATLARLVPVVVLPYIASVLFVSGLLTRAWRTIPQAREALDPRGLLPFWHWYIVTKEHAAQALVVHLVTFAPIGLMMWLRSGRRTAGGTWLAGLLGALFSLAMEVGRQFKPELEADFNDVAVGAVAAVLAYRWMPRVWSLFEEAIWPTPSPWATSGRPPAGRLTVIGVFASAACAGLVAVAVARYPLSQLWLGGGLLAYAALLWRWPFLWLIAVPFALPCIDLSPWSGWMLVGESDLVVLVTIAVLLLRDPPSRSELWPRGPAGVVLGFATAAMLLGVALGLASPVQEPGGTSNIYLSPWNALRVGKAFFEALALLPFLLRARRAGRDTLFGYGMIAGVIGVGAAVVAERLAFVGLFDLGNDYRVAGPFASMHIGGGHIGTYLAMALPFLTVTLVRPRLGGLIMGLAAAVLGGYALVVTFARTGYAVAALGLLMVALLWPIASLRRPRRRWLAAFVPVPFLLALAGLVISAATDSRFMSSRFTTLVPDLDVRIGNWKAGLEARDPSWRAALFGMGLGTYPRVAAARIHGRAVPSNFVVGAENGARYLSVLVRSADFFGQKIELPATGGLHLALSLRPHGGAGKATAILCAKWLLYSDDCAYAALPAPQAGQWNAVTVDFDAASLAGMRRARPVPRPVELAFAFPARQPFDMTGVSLRDTAGNELVANGRFTDGTARWLFTDDDHIAWRIMDLFLLLFFETGGVGLVAFLALTAVAIAGGVAAIRRGDPFGAPVIAGLLVFLGAGVMDGLADAPRLMTLFFLIALLGIGMQRPLQEDVKN